MEKAGDVRSFLSNVMVPPELAFARERRQSTDLGSVFRTPAVRRRSSIATPQSSAAANNAPPTLLAAAEDYGGAPSGGHTRKRKVSQAQVSSGSDATDVSKSKSSSGERGGEGKDPPAFGGGGTNNTTAAQKQVVATTEGETTLHGPRSDTSQSEQTQSDEQKRSRQNSLQLTPAPAVIPSAVGLKIRRASYPPMSSDGKHTADSLLEYYRKNSCDLKHEFSVIKERMEVAKRIRTGTASSEASSGGAASSSAAVRSGERCSSDPPAALQERGGDRSATQPEVGPLGHTGPPG